MLHIILIFQKDLSTPEGDSKPDEQFPIRSLVGGLQYIATMARPDICFALQRVARQVTCCTSATVKAAKRILSYLSGTKEKGPEYSPEKERQFRETYEQVAHTEGKQLPDHVAFTDADFAGCTVTLRSTSGSILYYRGTPVAWSAKRQTIRATSTCEAEYVAVYDMIRLSQSQGYLDWFMHDSTLPLIFVDNQSALALSRASIVTKRSKHMNLRFHMVRDHFKDLCYCPTELNKADPLTKPLVGDKYISMYYADAMCDDVVHDDDEFYRTQRAFFVSIDRLCL